MVKHNFGEKSAADLSAFDLCCRCTLARLRKIFSLVNLLHSPCFSAGRDFLCSEDFMFGDDKEKWAVNELVRKSEELKRLPRKDDFDDATRSRIKAFLGPWPRALEKAGLKTPGGKCKK